MRYIRAGKPRECSSIYVEKIVKNHLWENVTILRGRGCLVTKININFFVRNKVLNIFQITIFKKKEQYFPKNFWRITIFQRMGSRMTKMNTIFSMGNWAPNMALKFFPHKTTYCRLNESQETSSGVTFFPISVVLLDRLFPKNIGFTRVWTRTNWRISRKSVQNCDLYRDRSNYYKRKIYKCIFLM